MSKLSGTTLAGGEGARERVENDFYATSEESIKGLFDNFLFINKDSVLEPCVGQGHIARELEKRFGSVMAVDIVDRGYPNTIVGDFLSMDFGDTQFDAVITNPPFERALEFVQKSLQVTKRGGYVAMFLKITFLEGVKRKAFFEKYPPSDILVFSSRQNPLRNGEAVDENGKPWRSTVCYAWFIWHKGYNQHPRVGWI